MMKDMSARYEASFNSKDDGNSTSKVGVINFKDAGDVAFFKPKLGKNKINIIPYTVSSKNHPLTRGRDPLFEIGDSDYVMDIWVHRNIGPSKSNVLCPNHTYGKPCPICDMSAKLKKEGKDKESASLKASRRVFYNVEDVENAPGELQVFEASHYLFERELIEEARAEEGGFVDFAHPRKGKVISFKVAKEKKGSIEYNKFKNFDFEDRDEPLDEDLLDESIPFDKFLNVLSPKELEDIMYGSDDDDEEDDEEDDTPAVSKRRRPSYDDDEEDDDSDVKSESKKKYTLIEEAKGKCPFNYKYGTDCDKYKECDKCSKWSECYDSMKEEHAEALTSTSEDIPF